jgi:hypothetical protein
MLRMSSVENINLTPDEAIREKRRTVGWEGRIK